RYALKRSGKARAKRERNTRASLASGRRRHDQKVDESDLSEGFDSDSSPDSTKGSEGSETGSEKSDEEAETAFDVETDSDMNSQESRSDLEDMEDEGPPAESKSPVVAKTEAPEPVANGPSSLGPSEASIASNLQAMSTQLFQTKRCFRLAPTFSNVLLKPNCELPPSKEAAGIKPCVNGDVEKPSVAEPDDVSESEESISSGKSCRNERSLQEKLEIITNEGLLPTVKVFLDWLRTNTDLIIMCAQSSQSLWNRLSVLLNLLPSAADLQDSGLFLGSEVKSMLPGCELPELSACLLLPEDVALRNLPPLKNAHKRFNFEQDRPSLTDVEESVVRLCCIRSFGHFITRLQGSILQFNSEVGIFISIAQSEQDGMIQQAQAQFRMVSVALWRDRVNIILDMLKILYNLEVSQLEGSLQQPKAQCVMSPYLVPDTQALCQHLSTIRQLAASGRFIVIIPRTGKPGGRMRPIKAIYPAPTAQGQKGGKGPQTTARGPHAARRSYLSGPRGGSSLLLCQLRCVWPRRKRKSPFFPFSLAPHAPFLLPLPPRRSARGERGRESHSPSLPPRSPCALLSRRCGRALLSRLSL
uniref:DNA/RNA-binding domain-containing protein n=1 Tax=Anolis carolinensis TaxID=28377 RepID=H9GEV3_ANOCA